MRQNGTELIDCHFPFFLHFQIPHPQVEFLLAERYFYEFLQLIRR